MKPLASLLLTLLLLAGASGAAASPAPEIAISPAIPEVAVDGASPLTPTDMAALTGGAPDWVVAGCIAIGGFTGGRAIAKQLAKRAVVSTVCPWCGLGLTVATVGCLFI